MQSQINDPKTKELLILVSKMIIQDYLKKAEKFCADYLRTVYFNSEEWNTRKEYDEEVQKVEHLLNLIQFKLSKDYVISFN